MSFNADEHEYQNPYAPVPKGDYDFDVVSVEVKPTQAGDDRYNFTLEITEGASRGRKLWVAFIPYHKANPEYAQRECGRLSEFSRAVGVIRWARPEELCGRRCRGRVRISREDEDKNEVSGFIVPKLARGVPVSNPARDAYRDDARRPGEALKQSVAASSQQHRSLSVAETRRQAAPPVADMPEYFDDDVPF